MKCIDANCVVILNISVHQIEFSRLREFPSQEEVLGNGDRTFVEARGKNYYNYQFLNLAESVLLLLIKRVLQDHSS